jgi:hypothetical protein
VAEGAVWCQPVSPPRNPGSGRKHREFEGLRPPPLWPSGLIRSPARGLACRLPWRREWGTACHRARSPRSIRGLSGLAAASRRRSLR